MTFDEITRRRLALGGAGPAPLFTAPGAADLPEWQEVAVHTDSSNVGRSDGIVYQRCGGGRRVLRKRIGGGS